MLINFPRFPGNQLPAVQLTLQICYRQRLMLLIYFCSQNNLLLPRHTSGLKNYETTNRFTSIRISIFITILQFNAYYCLAISSHYFAIHNKISFSGGKINGYAFHKIVIKSKPVAISRMVKYEKYIVLILGYREC